jgi:hypothetical protein
LPGFILKPDIEHLGEVLAQLMRGSALDATSIGGHIELYSCCVVGSGEFLDFRFLALDTGDSQKVLVAVSIIVEDGEDHIISLWGGSMSCVTFLP